MGQLAAAQGQVKVAKKCKNIPTCDVPPSKCQTKNRKIFFSMSTRRLAESVESLNSSLALAAGDLWPKKGVARAVVKGLIMIVGLLVIFGSELLSLF